ncbi:hypothetical protein ILUMI_17048, partial [Ignelater luminosus]
NISSIRNDIGENDIWVCIDETMDIKSRYVCNIIVDKLSANVAFVPHLLPCKFARFFNESLGRLRTTELPNIFTYTIKIRIREFLVASCFFLLRIFSSSERGEHF